MFKRIMAWLYAVLMEVYNLVTDLLVPFLEIVIVVATAIPIVPVKYIAMMKIAEEFLKQVGSTREEVENRYTRKEYE